MQANRGSDKSAFVLLPDVEYRTAADVARIDLLRRVFGAQPPAGEHPPHWIASGLFEADGACAATLAFAPLVLLVGADRLTCAGIRLVVVAPDRRGRGLSRDLMTATLATCDARRVDLVLLYAEHADLYRRYGFQSVAQVAFTGVAPTAIGAPASRRLDPVVDAPQITRLLATRAPLSRTCALIDAPGLFMERIADDPDVALMHLFDLEALVLIEDEEDTLVLVDIVAARIPSLSRILGALGRSARTVKTLFPPDQLSWDGEPLPDDTGLMIRGTLPPSLRRPFRLPPTTEF